MFLKAALAAAALAAFGLALTSANREFVMYQEWFSNYSATAENIMQIKRAYNSNVTLGFNQLLLATLGNGTAELRRINAAAWEEIENTETQSEPCRRVVYDLFEFYTWFSALDLQDCVRRASNDMRRLTTESFFKYANHVNRELSRITHHVANALATYNKVLEIDNINDLLQENYYDFNWMFNQYQTVIDEELKRFTEDHPILRTLDECVDQTVYWHEGDMFYVVSYLEYYCQEPAVTTTTTTAASAPLS